jgi:hypothetical protein
VWTDFRVRPKLIRSGMMDRLFARLVGACACRTRGDELWVMDDIRACA